MSNAGLTQRRANKKLKRFSTKTRFQWEQASKPLRLSYVRCTWAIERPLKIQFCFRKGRRRDSQSRPIPENRLLGCTKVLPLVPLETSRLFLPDQPTWCLGLIYAFIGGFQFSPCETCSRWREPSTQVMEGIKPWIPQRLTCRRKEVMLGKTKLTIKIRWL